MAISGIGQNTYVYQTYFAQHDKTSAGNGKASAAAQALPASGGIGTSSSLIDEILEKGLQGWADEKRLEELKEKMRNDVMGELGVTTEDLEKMDEVVRNQVEQRIAEMVKERLEAAMKEGVGQQRAGTKPFLDISV